MSILGRNRIRVRSAAFIALVGALSLPACTGNPQARVARYIESGDAFLAQAKYAEAIIEYSNAVQIDPNSGPARSRLGGAYLENKQLDKALTELTRAADLMPDDADLQVRTGGLWLLVGQFEDARRIADRFLLRRPDYLPALVLRANALAGIQNLGDAIEQIEEAIQLDPTQAELYSNLGSFQARTGRLDEAEYAFQQAVKVAPDSAHAHTALGNFYLATRRLREAEQSFRAALDLDPQFLLAHRALSSLYLSTGRSLQAGDHLKAVADVTGDLEDRVSLADFRLLTNRREEGVQLLEAVAREEGGYYVARTRLAALAYAEGRREDAHAILDEILGRARYAQAMLLKAEFFRKEGNSAEALTRARNALEVNPNLLAAHYLTGELYQEQGDTLSARQAFERVLLLNPRAAAAQSHLADLEMQRGNMAVSLEYAERAVRNQPENVNARLMLARVLVRQGNGRRAESELAMLARQFPDAAQVHALRGSIALLRRDFAAARRSYEEALRRDPRSFDALAGMLGLEIATNRGTEAKARIDREIERAPTDVDLVMLGAQTYAATGDLVGAEALLKRAIDADSSRPEPFNALAMFYVRQNRLDEGKREFERIVERDPRSIGAHTMIATILRRQGYTDEAAAQYQKVLAIDHEAAVAANNLAWIYADRGQFLEEGLRLARIARSKMPSQPEVIDTIGWLYYKLRQPALALPYIKEAIQHDPKNPQYHYHLAAVHARSGESFLALEALKEAFRLGQDFYGAEEARRLLDRLQR